ncbi:MAG TPA: hypothetical protein H9903_10230 [Candidatus Aquabacterium excrementipullorum]|nr:hypothetical protein [Candidatus Aquabacterium excrementipullorum]
MLSTSNSTNLRWPRLAAGILAMLALQAQATPSKLIVFGDSLSDNGNASALVGQWGIDLPASPYDDGRFSNGPVAVEVMASQLGVTLEDHAFGGALTGLNNRIEALGLLNGTGLQGQINTYLTDTGHKADASALYVVWGGGNDFLSSPTAATVATAIDNLAQNVTLLYQAGARDFFIPNLPDLATTSDAIEAGGADQAGAHQLSLSFNAALKQTMAGLQSSLQGANIQVFDTLGTLVSIRDSYIAQGFNVTQGCWDGDMFGKGTLCADPSKYYLWDGLHPTAGVHQALGQAFAQAAVVPEPAAWALSLAGVAMVSVLAARRRREATLA